MKNRRTPGARLGRGALAVGVLALALVTQACGPATATPHVTSAYFGMHAPGLDTAWPQASVGTVNLTTNGVYWPQLEPAPGTFDFTHLDTVVDQAHAHRAQPLLILGQTPSFHSKTPHAANVLGSVPKMAAWRTYVARVAGRYGTRVDYQIWPEANAASNWAGSRKQLAALVAAASKIIHAKAKKAVVVSPAMVIRLSFQQRALSKFFATRVGGKRVGSYVDAVAIDAYPLQRGTPEDSAALIKKARRILAAQKVRAPLWNVEINYGVAGGHAPVSSFPASKQASYVMRTFLLNAANGVKRVQWLAWADINELAIQMVQPDGVTPTAAGKAFVMVRAWMIGQSVPSCVSTRATHLYACKTVRAGHASWVYWTTKGTARVKAPQGSRHLQRMLGTPTATHAGKRITVTTAPVRVYH